MIANRIIATAGLAFLLAMAVPVQAAGSFEQVRAKTFSKDKFVFPDDLSGGTLNVLFLAMSADRDNGEYQQGALLDWQAALDERGVFSDGVVAWHFPVMPSPPFFVKGLIAGALGDAYEGLVPPDHAAVLYVDDLDAFAAQADLALDERPTIVIAGPDGTPLQSFKGDVTPSAADAVAAAIVERRTAADTDGDGP